MMISRKPAWGRRVAWVGFAVLVLVLGAIALLLWRNLISQLTI
jgi:hypothetical protein